MKIKYNRHIIVTDGMIPPEGCNIPKQKFIRMFVAKIKEQCDHIDNVCWMMRN